MGESLISAFMSIKKDTVELRDFDEIVEYLKLGWMLTGDYIMSACKDGRPDPALRYILAWRREGEPPRPERIGKERASVFLHSSRLYVFRKDDLASPEKPRVERERART